MNNQHKTCTLKEKAKVCDFVSFSKYHAPVLEKLRGNFRI